MTEPTAQPQAQPQVEAVDAAPSTDTRRARGFPVGRVLLLLAFVASVGFILYVAIQDRDQSQLPLLGAGFGALGLSFAIAALMSLGGMWRAAAWGRGGRATLLAIVGGIAGLGAIGCFTLTALFALVIRS